MIPRVWSFRCLKQSIQTAIIWDVVELLSGKFPTPMKRNTIATGWEELIRVLGPILSEVAPVVGMPHIFFLDPNGLTVKLTNTEIKVSYSAITRLYEDKERFYLFTDLKSSYALPKRSMEYQQIDAFRDFLTSSTGLQIK